MEAMKAKSFRLYGQTFTPHRKFTKLENAIGSQLPLYSIGISNYGEHAHNYNSITGNYEYDEFYAKAKKLGADKIDIFLMNGKIEVVPCSNEIFQYKEENLKYSNSERKIYFEP